MSGTDDPFTQVLDGIWDALEAWPAFTSQVRLANRLKLPENAEDPYKPTVGNSDLPEMVIEPAGGSTRLSFSSSNFQTVQNYALQIATGKLSPRKFLAVKWAVICALAQANKQTNPFGLKFVHDIGIVDESEVLDNQDSGRTETGWSGRITIQATLNFSRDLMVAPD
ncbi:MAG: hypothetical protein HZA50_11620 [Planctomycetes bacterium]|nr:hypothetical protein [Planctomycetota bacterium]